MNQDWLIVNAKARQVHTLKNISHEGAEEHKVHEVWA